MNRRDDTPELIFLLLGACFVLAVAGWGFEVLRGLIR
jgi:hypothetical protein